MFGDDEELTAKTLLHNAVNLYLFVQIPEQNAENIVVIENNSADVLNISLINEHAQKPYSDKLLGYLLDYFITPLSTIETNIAHIQSMLSSKDYPIKDCNGNTVGTLTRL